jgi:predicted protein tyrosine phosphatase
MDWINDKIAIGNFLEARDSELLAREGIRSVLSLDGSLRAISPADLGLERIEHVPLEDAPGNDFRMFKRAVDLVADLVSTHPPVLVHCHAGRSRSPVVVAGYLVVSEAMSPEDALALVAERREIAVTRGVDSLLYYL